MIAPWGFAQWEQAEQPFEKHENEDEVRVQYQAGIAEAGSGSVEGKCKVKCRPWCADKGLQNSGSDSWTTKFGFVSDQPPAAIPFRKDAYEDRPNGHDQTEEEFHDGADFRTGVKWVCFVSSAFTGD